MDKLLVLSGETVFNNLVKRIITHYSFEFLAQEVNVNSINRTLKQYHPAVLIIHHSVKCSNLSILLDYLVTNKIIPVIYINNVINYGTIYHVMNDLYFMNIDEKNLSSLLPFGVEFLVKLGIQFSNLNKKVEQLEHKLEEEKLVVRAKFKLMKEKNMTEDEAYKWILKESMDNRISKSDVAREILKN